MPQLLKSLQPRAHALQQKKPPQREPLAPQPYSSLYSLQLIHVNVWQNPLKCCEVISLQLIKINEKKNLHINKDWAQPKIKMNNIILKQNKRKAVGQVNWSDISILAMIYLYLCSSLQRKSPWGQELFLICICNYCILFREVKYSHPSAHLSCYCLSLSRPQGPRCCFCVECEFTALWGHIDQKLGSQWHSFVGLRN